MNNIKENDNNKKYKIKGLNEKEVKKLFKDGFFNIDVSPKPKSILEILKSNFFTLFNLVNLILAIMILFTGSLRNLMFMLVVVCNSLISLLQELRARKATEKLKLMTSKTVYVIRNFKKTKIDIQNIVLGDILILDSGCQIPSDCKIIEGECEVNESLLTGESDIIEKKIKDTLLSGSFIVSGSIIAKAIKVGKDTFSAKISKNLKNIEIAKSEIMIVVNKIIRIVSIIILPVGIPLFLNQLRSSSFNYQLAILNTSAAIIGMIPEGLALLTSSVLALGATKLARRKILAKDIYSVETLARIDTMCFDKTGTITEGNFETVGILSNDSFFKGLEFTKINSESISNKNYDISEKKLIESIIYLASSLKDNNQTMKAIKSLFYKKEFDKKCDFIIPFSSSRKFSAVFFEGKGSYIIGSIEFIFKNGIKNCDKDIKELLKPYENYRVLAVAHTKQKISKENLSDDIDLLGIILLRDKIRKNIKEILTFFKKNKINVKIISGDGLESVSKIAKIVGIEVRDDGDKKNIIDAQELKTYNDVINVVKKCDIFARVTPEKKREIIKALKIKGHKVAMTGDGVNDVLALKEADCSIALSSGSSAAREVSHFIIMNEDFASIPEAVAQGRMAINNIKTASSLFLVKTIYSIILSSFILIFAFPYPFMPIQMSLISTLTIGIPSFLLAFEKNTKKIKNSFFLDVIKTSLPSALIICLNLIFCFILKKIFHLSHQMYSSISIFTTGALGISLLQKIMVPMNSFRKLIFAGVIITFTISLVFYSDVFFITKPFFWGIKNILFSMFILLISLTCYRFINSKVKN